MYKKYNEQLNLNLLRVFNAIYIYRSTKKASLRLGISQSAVSQTLAKLRDFTGDKLFYMSGSELQATHRADEIGRGLNEQLDQLDSRLYSNMFSNPHDFDGELIIAVSSVLLESIATEITSSVVFEMFPNAKINITTWTDKTFDAIKNGEVHIGLNFYPIETPKSIRTISLTPSEPVIMAKKNHPWALSGYSLEAFNNYQTGGILVPGLTDFHALLEQRHPDIFQFKYRSASMSVLTRLAENSDMLAVTETLSASMCPDSLECIKPEWLDLLFPEKISHAIYYLEKNHGHPLYQNACNIVRKSFQSKLEQLYPQIINPA